MATSQTAQPVRTINTAAKDTLARLMSTENLTVVHDAAASTACFDTSTRTLTLPVYDGKLVTEAYDMLIGHEVGHALFTPADKETIVTAMDSIDANNHAVVHDFLNIIEDARIERKMKSKYPGLRRCFAVGYAEFLKNDFFGLNGRQPNDFPLVDRLNLHFKGGIHCGLQVNFTAEEQTFVTMMEQTKSFEDVVDVARAVYDFVGQSKKTEKPTIINVIRVDAPNGNPGSSNETPSDTSEGNPSDIDASQDESSNGNPSQDEPSNGKSSEGTQTNEEASKGDSSEGETNESGSSSNNPTLQTPQTSDPTVERSETSSSMDRAVAKMRDNNAGRAQYFRVPTLDLNHVIVPHAQIHNDISDKRSTLIDMPRYNGKKLLEKFNSNSKEYIATLVREFERKMAADESRRTSTSRSGNIDMSRIHTYQFAEDIFLKNTTVADGKNHGMVIFIDWSGSMAKIMENTVYQLMNLILFCNSLKIPYEVYAFSSYPHPNLANDTKESGFDPYAHPAAKISKDYKVVKRNSFAGDDAVRLETSDFLVLGVFSLLQLCSSSMNKKEMRIALENLMFIARNVNNNSVLPHYLGLGSTPLDEAVIAAIQILPEFKAATKAQIVNTIFLTDGESGSYVFAPNNRVPANSNGQIVLRAKSGHDYTLDSRKQDTSSFLRSVLREESKSSVLGFFLVPVEIAQHYLGKYFRTTSEINAAYSILKTNKFVTISGRNWGYDKYFVIDANTKSSSNNDTVRGLDASETFSKTMQNKKTTRALLSQFADTIARDFVY